MNIDRKYLLGGLAGILFAVSAQAQIAPLAAPAQPKAAPQAAAEESSQKIWDEDVARVSREIGKMKLKARVKERVGRALDAYRKGDYDRVRALAPEILKLDPEAIEATEFLASAAFMRGDKKAVEMFDQAIEARLKWLERHTDPEERRDGVKQLSVLYGNRGVAKLMGDPTGAIVDFDEALKNGTPLKAMIMWEKSEALVALHRYDEAADLFEGAVKMDPSLKARGNVKFPDPTARNLCQVLAVNGRNIQACN